MTPGMSPTDELLALIRALCGPLEPLPTGVAPRLERLDGVRAVLFDVYGTLLVSGSGDVGTLAAASRADAVEASLAHWGVAEEERRTVAQRAVDAFVATIAADHETARDGGIDQPEVDIRDVWRRVLAELGVRDGDRLDDPDLVAFALDYECRVNPVWPMPGARQTVEALAHRDVELGIVSNAQVFTPWLFQALLGARVEELGFDASLCEWSWRRLEAKPSTRLFATVLERLRTLSGLEPDAVLYVGNDQRNDVCPAARLGCRTALFAGDQRSLRRREDDESCRAVEPDIVITHLEQLLECVGPSASD